MKNKWKALMNAISKYVGLPIKGLVSLTPDKTLRVKHARFSDEQLKELRKLAKDFDPVWQVNQQKHPSRGYSEAVTWIGPPKGSSEDELFAEITSE